MEWLVVTTGRWVTSVELGTTGSVEPRTTLTRNWGLRIVEAEAEAACPSWAPASSDARPGEVSWPSHSNTAAHNMRSPYTYLLYNMVTITSCGISTTMCSSRYPYYLPILLLKARTFWGFMPQILSYLLSYFSLNKSAVARLRWYFKVQKHIRETRQKKCGKFHTRVFFHGFPKLLCWRDLMGDK